MKTLLERLKPEIKLKLEANTSEYTNTIANIFENLSYSLINRLSPCFRSHIDVFNNVMSENVYSVLISLIVRSRTT